MKKFLFGILTFLGIGLSFCSASFCDISYSDADVYLGNYYEDTFLITPTKDNSIQLIVDDGYSLLLNINSLSIPYFLFDSDFNLIGEYSDYFFVPAGTYYINTSGSITGTPSSTYSYSKSHNFNHFSVILPDEEYFPIFNFFSYFYYNLSSYSFQGGGSSSCEDGTIGVLYNSGNSYESITCDGNNIIEIKGLSSLTSSNTFTPYYNISYKDEDNQSLIESYSKDILYLENGLFKKTYTGNNDWILTVQLNSENSFSGYLPTFEITGSVDPNDEFTGNVFNNFADNSLKYLFSNIPSYIQYFIILLILFLILGFVKKFKRK